MAVTVTVILDAIRNITARHGEPPENFIVSPSARARLANEIGWPGFEEPPIYMPIYIGGVPVLVGNVPDDVIECWEEP